METEQKEHQYTIRGLKTFKGMEGMGGFNVTLCHAGQPVCFIINEDCGGEYYWQWKAPEHEALVQAIVDALPEEPFGHGMEGTFKPDRDCWIATLVGEYENTKRFDRLSKTKTLFRIQGDKEGEYRVIKAPYTDPRVKPYLDKTYGK